MNHPKSQIFCRHDKQWQEHLDFILLWSFHLFCASIICVYRFIFSSWVFPAWQIWNFSTFSKFWSKRLQKFFWSYHITSLSNSFLLGSFVKLTFSNFCFLPLIFIKFSPFSNLIWIHDTKSEIVIFVNNC